MRYPLMGIAARILLRYIRFVASDTAPRGETTMHGTSAWTFTTARITVDLELHDCDDLDLSWDEDGSVLDGLERGVFIAFDASVVVRLDGHEVGRDWLGQCIYRSADDFRYGGGYFPDMVREAIAEARRNIAKLQDFPLRMAA
jgi:hypothetical protein